MENKTPIPHKEEEEFVLSNWFEFEYFKFIYYYYYYYYSATLNKDRQNL